MKILRNRYARDIQFFAYLYNLIMHISLRGIIKNNKLILIL